MEPVVGVSIPDGEALVDHVVPEARFRIFENVMKDVSGRNSSLLLSAWPRKVQPHVFPPESAGEDVNGLQAQPVLAVRVAKAADVVIPHCKEAKGDALRWCVLNTYFCQTPQSFL